MSSSSRRSGSRQSRSRSASNISFRSSRTSSYRNAYQQTSDTGYRSSRRDSSTGRSSSSTYSEHDHPVRSPSPSPSRAPNRKRFGLNAPSGQPRVPGKFDFEDKYPEDPIYEEMGPNARLWRAFLDESEVFDMDMVTESRDGLDLLLVFAGLFSAVLTTFVTQTSQALSTNFPAVSSSLMVEMVALQRAQINNTSIDDILPADTTAGPSGFDIWVNALWFTSLTLSLGTALIAVLVKQWLYQYMSMISGTARDRSLIRYYRFEGLQKWHVLTIIGILPIVLHIALGLFLAGLVIFLIPLNTPLACVVGFITLGVYTLYAVSNILPLVYIQCPYRTPFSDILNLLLRSLKTFPSLAMMHLYKILRIFGHATTISSIHTEDKHISLKQRERLAATNDDVAEDVAWRALSWLHSMTSNSPTKRIIQESLGCLSEHVSQRSRDIQADLEQTLGEISPVTWDNTQRVWYRSIPSGQERRVERILRAVRDPLASGDGRVTNPFPLWRLDPIDPDLTFQTITSILVHAPNVNVKIGIDSVYHNLHSLRTYFIGQQHSLTPIRLPPQLWTLLIDSTHTSWLHEYSSASIEQLCDLAVSNFNGVEESSIPPPFAGPVAITHRAVPLFHLVVDLLVHHLGVPPATDGFDLEPLTKLFTVYDYAASESHLDLNATTIDNLRVLTNTWAAIARLDNPVCDKDAAILCRRVEDAVLQMTMTEDWWNSRDEGMRCKFYDNALGVYRLHNLAEWHPNGSKFFQKLLSDLSSSLARDSPTLFFRISKILEKMLGQHENAPVYYPLFCAAPFLSGQTTCSFGNCREFLYLLVSVFVDNMSRGNTAQCMESLCTDPERFFTIYRIIMLGPHPSMRLELHADVGEHIKERLLNLARLDPSHAVWTNRAHYMNMDPRDWAYLRLVDEELKDEALMAWVKDAMDFCSSIIDEFFASDLDTSTPGSSMMIRGTAEQSQTVPQLVSHDVSRWMHLRRLVSGVGLFPSLLPASHDQPMDDVERTLQASRRISVESPYHTDSDVYDIHFTPRY